ncbi:MAG: aminotransferase class III-fold pyridoxal phosphate-dependent enzyme [Armatimonadota bacterium]|nr:aminotransferase class III-fold pyridoxal phosphate-dependent enzyme [Armatimonadota bacterium]
MEHTPQEVESITQDVIEKYQKFVNPTQVALLKVGGFDHIEHHAEGVMLTDLEGNSYIDCLGGYGVFSLGHRHPQVVAAVKRQLDLMPLASKTFLNKPLADLSAKLAELAPGDLQYSFISSSGTEAAEAALKIARMASGKTDFISTIGAYHGKTMGALSVTGREVYRKPFEPMLPGASFVPFNDAEAIEAAITDMTAAVILEPVQGEGGIQVPSPDYFPCVREICDRHGVLLIVDEVQTGLGRTGRMFGVDHWNVKPDILTLAKALGGGVMPIGATLATAAIWNKVFHENPFIHTTTFGGGELACVAALAALEVTVEEDLPAKAAENGAYFLDGLKRIQAAHPNILKEARGLGLMLGVEFTDSDIGKLVIGTMVHRGVIAAYTLNNPKVIRFEPPLIITHAQIDQVLEVFAAGVQDALDLLGDLI